MKFEMTKEKLLDVLNRLKNVSTRGIKSEFDKAGRVTISVQKEKVTFSSTNGFLSAVFDINKHNDEKLKIDQEGTCTVNAIMACKITKSLGGADSDSHILKLDIHNKNLRIKDPDAKNGSVAKMETIDETNDISVKKPSNSFSHEFETEVLRKCISNVSKYVSVTSYEVRFLMSCFHFLKNEVRSVCGDGSRFAVFVHPLPAPDETIKDENGFKFLLPVDQSAIMLSVLDPQINAVNTAFRKDECYMSQKNGIQLLLKGIPQVTYILYEQEAFRSSDANVIVDFETDSFIQGIDLVMSVDDQNYDNNKQFHSCKFTASEDGNIKFIVDENKYTCEFSSKAQYYKLKKLTSFEAYYAALFLHDITKSESRDYIRFYFIDPSSTLIARPVNLSEAKDDNGVPIINTDKGDYLIFFFVSAEEEGGDN